MSALTAKTRDTKISALWDIKLKILIIIKTIITFRVRMKSSIKVNRNKASTSLEQTVSTAQNTQKIVHLKTMKGLVLNSVTRITNLNNYMI